MLKERKNHVHLQITVENYESDIINKREYKDVNLYDYKNTEIKTIFNYDDLDWNDALKIILEFADTYEAFEVSLYATPGKFGKEYD